MRSSLLVMLIMAWVFSASAAEPFVAHEWGVYVRSSALIKAGTPLSGKLTEMNVLSAPDELIAGLPGFVKRHATHYTPRQESRAWNKPVIHFYGPDQLAVKIEVQFPQGTPLAY